MAFHEFTKEWTPLPRTMACVERPAGYRSSNIAMIRRQGVGVETRHRVDHQESWYMIEPS
jgi:hypothetical protein